MERDHSGNLGVSGRIILKQILKKYGKRVQLIHLTKDRVSGGLL
jgi:hypothetical protein